MRALLPLFKKIQTQLLGFVGLLIEEARRDGFPIREDAEDIVHKVFIKVSIPGYLDPSRSHVEKKKYIFKTAFNLIMNLRRSGDSSVISLGGSSFKGSRPSGRGSKETETSAPIVDPVDPKGEEPPAVLIRQEIREAVWRAIACLPPLEREALLMHYSEGFSYAEIAVARDTTVEAVTGRLKRARTKVREALERNSIGPADWWAVRAMAFEKDLLLERNSISLADWWADPE
jgi:RNA polymerase sigma factor (sigma-70 family)